jgi:hypothetical protein
MVTLALVSGKSFSIALIQPEVGMAYISAIALCQKPT